MRRGRDECARNELLIRRLDGQGDLGLASGVEGLQLHQDRIELFLQAFAGGVAGVLREFAQVGARELEGLLPCLAGIVLVSGAPEGVAQVVVEGGVLLAAIERDGPPEERDGAGAEDCAVGGDFVGDDVLVVAEPGERIDDAGLVGEELRGAGEELLRFGEVAAAAFEDRVAEVVRIRSGTRSLIFTPVIFSTCWLMLSIC